MMTDNVLDKKKKVTPRPSREKFFFNQNIFDEDYKDPNEPPPPPTFSEEELAEAKQHAFTQGKSEGVTETQEKEKQSRSLRVTQALEKIAAATQELFQQELKREEQYEREALTLSLAIFEALFPVYNQTHGFEELKQHIHEIIQKNRKIPEIKIYVSEENRDSVETFLQKATQHGHNGTFTVYSDPDLSDSACRLSWPQGGSSFDKNKIAEETREIIQQMLAASATTSHDENSDMPAEAPPSQNSDNTTLSEDVPLETIKTEMEKPDE